MRNSVNIKTENKPLSSLTSLYTKVFAKQQINLRLKNNFLPGNFRTDTRVAYIRSCLVLSSANHYSIKTRDDFLFCLKRFSVQII